MACAWTTGGSGACSISTCRRWPGAGRRALAAWVQKCPGEVPGSIATFRPRSAAGRAGFYSYETMWDKAIGAMRADRQRRRDNDPRTHSVGVLEDYAQEESARPIHRRGGLHEAPWSLNAKDQFCSGHNTSARRWERATRRLKHAGAAAPRCFGRRSCRGPGRVAVPLGAPVRHHRANATDYARRCDCRGAARRASAPGGIAGGPKHAEYDERSRCARSCASRPRSGPTRGPRLRGGLGGAPTPSLRDGRAAPL